MDGIDPDGIDLCRHAGFQPDAVSEVAAIKQPDCLVRFRILVITVGVPRIVALISLPPYLGGNDRSWRFEVGRSDALGRCGIKRDSGKKAERCGPAELKNRITGSEHRATPSNLEDALVHAISADGKAATAFRRLVKSMVSVFAAILGEGEESSPRRRKKIGVCTRP